ncbi:MAG: ABC transporter permease [Planctomycetota bacterium]|jgi:NitT/TauT family transport system permease protein|nr:ABC transporter permease [Planctomycetota bacterium]
MGLTLEQRRELRRRKDRRDRIVGILAPTFTFVLLLAAWEALVVWLEIPTWQIPRPSSVFAVMFGSFGEFLPHIIRSYSTIIIAFACASVVGVALAAILTNFKALGVALTPYINMLCTTPVITLVPLLLLMFGFGQWVLILAVTLQAFPILNMNASTGFNNVETLKLELMGSLRATRVQTFRHCILPASLPNVFTGMKLSGIFATTACVSSEFSGGNRGLGARIIAYTQFMKMDKAFACIFFVAVIGLFLYTLTSYLETRVVKWKI